MNDAVTIRLIPPEGPLYAQERALRGKVLREPLGMGPEVEMFPFEAESIHVAALDPAGNVVGCLLFHPRGDSGRVYQMAVRPDLQGTGIGTGLVRFLEAEMQRRSTRALFLHARSHVAPFYARLGFRTAGEPFIEIGIPHVRMEKHLALPAPA